jgi:predicted nuclease with TOPRIM domain
MDEPHNLFDLALVLEQYLKALNMSMDNLKTLQLFAIEADSFHVYLNEQKEKCEADLVEAEHLRDRAEEVDDEAGFMEANDMCDRFHGDVLKTGEAISHNKGEIIKIKQSLSIAEDTVRYWSSAWVRVVVNVAECLHQTI